MRSLCELDKQFPVGTRVRASWGTEGEVVSASACCTRNADRIGGAFTFDSVNFLAVKYDYAASPMRQDPDLAHFEVIDVLGDKLKRLSQKYPEGTRVAHKDRPHLTGVACDPREATLRQNRTRLTGTAFLGLRDTPYVSIRWDGGGIGEQTDDNLVILPAEPEPTVEELQAQVNILKRDNEAAQRRIEAEERHSKAVRNERDHLRRVVDDEQNKVSALGRQLADMQRERSEAVVSRDRLAQRAHRLQIAVNSIQDIAENSELPL